jgi:hypothetical protein
MHGYIAFSADKSEKRVEYEDGRTIFYVYDEKTQRKHIFDDEVRVLEIEHKHAP